MNDQVIARPCWTVLTEKAEDKIAAIQNEMGLARKRLESLQLLFTNQTQFFSLLTKFVKLLVGWRLVLKKQQLVEKH